MTDSAEVRKLRAEIQAHRSDLQQTEARVIVLEQNAKETTKEMNDWIRSGIEHRTGVNIQLQAVADDVAELKSIPVDMAKIGAKLDQALKARQPPVYFWNGPNAKWVVIGTVTIAILLTGVKNVDTIVGIIGLFTHG